MTNRRLSHATQIEKQKNNPLSYILLKARPRWWMLYDIIVAIVALKIASLCYAKYIVYQLLLTEYFCFPALFLIAGSIVGLYERNAFNDFVKLFLSLLATTILAVIGLTFVKNIFLYEQIGRHVLLLIFIVTIFSCALARLFVYYYIGSFSLRILFVGSEKRALSFKKYFEPSVKYYSFIGYCDDGLEPNVLRLGSVDDLDKICCEQQIDLVVIDDDYIGKMNVFDKCLKLIRLNCAIMDKEGFIEQSFEQVAVDEVDPVWFYRANLGEHDNLQWTLKRSVDIFFAALGLAFTALIYPFIWVAIKLTSPGPVLYSQVRCGRFDKEFKIYKFRTMQINAEKNGAVWAKQNDDRITKVGNVLRKTRLDELPQFWNILIGDMSLVGPRPERPELVKKIEEHVPCFYFRHFVNPGITGFAQIRYRYGASVEDAKEKLKYDLYYAKNWSFFMDMQIILRTIVTIMKGAR